MLTFALLSFALLKFLSHKESSVDGFLVNNSIRESQFLSLKYFHNAAFSITFIIQNFKSDLKFKPEKQCFKVTDRETNYEKGIMYFWMAVYPFS